VAFAFESGTVVNPRSRLVVHFALAAALGLPFGHPSAQTPDQSMPATAVRPTPDTVVGHVKSASGDAYVVHGASSVRAEPGMPIHLGAVLRTGADGSLGATLKDNTRISFGPGSEFRIEDFRYAPADGRLGLAATLLRGTLDFVSGIVTRLRPESTVIRTPTSTVGIRGTHILVKVDE